MCSKIFEKNSNLQPFAKMLALERADGSRAGSGAQGIAVRWPDICGTWLQTLSTGSHDHEVTPHGSIRPPLFDDVLVVRARKTENEKDKKKTKQKG